MYTSEISKLKQFRGTKLDEQEINSIGECFTVLESKMFVSVKLISEISMILIFTPEYCHQI